jgi:hypothetical protein
MKDLKKDTDGDLLISNNDLVIGISDLQHQEDLILTEKGSVKQYPEAGVGAASYLENDEGAELLREIGLQFTADGMDVQGVSLLDNGNIKFEGAYPK